MISTRSQQVHQPSTTQPSVSSPWLGPGFLPVHTSSSGGDSKPALPSPTPATPEPVKQTPNPSQPNPKPGRFGMFHPFHRFMSFDKKLIQVFCFTEKNSLNGD